MPRQGCWCWRLGAQSGSDGGVVRRAPVAPCAPPEVAPSPLLSASDCLPPPRSVLRSNARQSTRRGHSCCNGLGHTPVPPWEMQSPPQERLRPDQNRAQVVENAQPHVSRRSDSNPASSMPQPSAPVSGDELRHDGEHSTHNTALRPRETTKTARTVNARHYGDEGVVRALREGRESPRWARDRV